MHMTIGGSSYSILVLPRHGKEKHKWDQSLGSLGHVTVAITAMSSNVNSLWGILVYGPFSEVPST